MALTSAQYSNIAAILNGIGHVFLVSIAIPYFIDRFDPTIALFGLIIALVAWGYSIYISK